MKSYAISHALLGTTFVAVLKDDGSQPDVLRLRNEEAKEEFMLNTLEAGDVIFTDLGGSADKLSLVATVRGVTVNRIPTFRLGNKARYAEDVQARGWSSPDEQPHGSETGEELTVRKTRALAITVASMVRPQEFSPTRDEDKTLLIVKQEYRSFRMMQKVLLANTQRLLSVYNDRYLLELARDVSRQGGMSGLLSGKKVSAQAALKAVNALLVDIPENEREAFAAKLGLDKLMGKVMIPRKAVKQMFEKIIDALLSAGPMSPFMEAMKETEKSIVKHLKSHEVFRKVFDPLPGCGPRIAARLMASIVDIRRFESDAALKAYAGYHHFEDGSRARRRAGKVSNWNTELKQAVFLWTEQTLKLPQSPWRAKLDKRRAYELYKILRDRQLKAMAMSLGLKILPDEFMVRTIKSVEDIQDGDLGVLAAQVDALRLKAGIKAHVEEDENEEETGEEAEISAKDPKLAKLVRGLKMQALQKAKRWLGQKLLQHIRREWRKAIGLSEYSRPVKPRTEQVHVPMALPEAAPAGAMLQ